MLSLCSPSVWTDKTLPAESRCRREKQADKYVNAANAATCRVTTTTLKIHLLLDNKKETLAPFCCESWSNEQSAEVSDEAGPTSVTVTRVF